MYEVISIRTLHSTQATQFCHEIEQQMYLNAAKFSKTSYNNLFIESYIKYGSKFSHSRSWDILNNLWVNHDKQDLHVPHCNLMVLYFIIML